MANRAKSDLAKLAGEINWYEEEARKTVMLALQYKLEIGRRLMAAKALLPHGKFLSWAHDQFGWTPRHVQRHLKLAEYAPRVSRLPAETSLRMALAAIKKLGNEADEGAPLPDAENRTQLIHIVAELGPGAIDRERLSEEVANFAKELGAQKMRWKIR